MLVLKDVFRPCLEPGSSGGGILDAENTHRWGKHHCTAGLQFNKTGTDE